MFNRAETSVRGYINEFCGGVRDYAVGRWREGNLQRAGIVFQAVGGLFALIGMFAGHHSSVGHACAVVGTLAFVAPLVINAILYAAKKIQQELEKRKEAEMGNPGAVLVEANEPERARFLRFVIYPILATLAISMTLFFVGGAMGLDNSKYADGVLTASEAVFGVGMGIALISALIMAVQEKRRNDKENSDL